MVTASVIVVGFVVDVPTVGDFKCLTMNLMVIILDNGNSEIRAHVWCGYWFFDLFKAFV